MAPLSRGQMPRKKSQSFADAFDDDCAKLSAKVDAQSESLHVMHVQRMNRDFKQLRTLNSEAVRLRSEIEQLTTDLQPRLERLAAKEAKQAVSAASLATDDWVLGADAGSRVLWAICIATAPFTVELGVASAPFATQEQSSAIERARDVRLPTRRHRLPLVPAQGFRVSARATRSAKWFWVRTLATPRS